MLLCVCIKLNGTKLYQIPKLFIFISNHWIGFFILMAMGLFIYDSSFPFPNLFQLDNRGNRFQISIIYLLIFRLMEIFTRWCFVWYPVYHIFTYRIPEIGFISNNSSWPSVRRFSFLYTTSYKINPFSFSLLSRIIKFIFNYWIHI